jgi:hypothetical protein
MEGSLDLRNGAFHNAGFYLISPNANPEDPYH